MSEEDLKAEIARLRQALEDYADHQSWRCHYRTRYHYCYCGLDDLFQALDLPLIPPNDPEAKR